MMAMNKKDLNYLIKKLPDKHIPLVADFIRELISSNSKETYIPYDDESLTTEELEAIKQAEENYRNGKGIKLEEIEDELRNRT